MMPERMLLTTEERDESGPPGMLGNVTGIPVSVAVIGQIVV